MNKKAIITSALPYSNGEIHLGHVASTYLPADVTTRFLKQNGVEAYYICASDDFGTPILIQSEKEGKTPEEYVAHWNKRDLEDFTAFDIAFDFFYKTSSEENIEFVQRASCPVFSRKSVTSLLIPFHLEISSISNILPSSIGEKYTNEITTNNSNINKCGPIFVILLII